MNNSVQEMGLDVSQTSAPGTKQTYRYEWSAVSEKLKISSRRRHKHFYIQLPIAVITLCRFFGVYAFGCEPSFFIEPFLIYFIRLLDHGYLQAAHIFLWKIADWKEVCLSSALCSCGKRERYPLFYAMSRCAPV